MTQVLSNIGITLSDYEQTSENGPIRADLKALATALDTFVGAHAADLFSLIGGTGDRAELVHGVMQGVCHDFHETPGTCGTFIIQTK